MWTVLVIAFVIYAFWKLRGVLREHQATLKEQEKPKPKHDANGERWDDWM